MNKDNIIKLIKERIPVLTWLPHYKAKDALGDIVAGFTVGLTLIPQAIAYAGLAGLEPQYGLYSAFAGSFVYIFFGTCREVNIGPTALISLLTWTYARGIPEFASLLCFLSGCITILFGVLRLGFLIDFISIPVVSAFTSAASVIIACSQIKGLLGLNIHGESFIEIWRELVYNITDTRIPDLILSCFCIATLLSLRYLKDVKVDNIKLRKFLWIIGTARNALVVIACAVASMIFEKKCNKTPFVLTGHVNAGLPNVQPPQFSRTVNNEVESFVNIVERYLQTGILIVPLISIIGNVAIAKTFSRGATLNASQEIFSLGICNLFGSFFQSMPVTGSFSRSAVNNASGVRTSLGGLYTGILVILALSLLTPYFYYIPKATLSSVIITAVIFMIEVKTLRSIWKCNKRDLIPAFVTFFACLFAGVELGILIGSIIDLAILIYLNARPQIYIEHRNNSTMSYILIRPSAGLSFPTVDYLRTYLTKSSDKFQNSSINDNICTNVVLDCEHIDKIDFTAAQGISTVINDFNSNNRKLIMLRPIPDVLQKVQSLLEKPILIAKNDDDLISILINFTDVKLIREENNESQVSDFKIITTENEFTTNL